jgi:hypothetical protein
MRRLLVLLSLFSVVSVAAEQSLVVDDAQRLIGLTDDAYQWSYSLDTGNWTWGNGTENWSYDAASSTCSESSTGERWVYDAAYDVWVHAFVAEYALATSVTFDHQAWRYDSDTGVWHLVTRVFDGDTYSFTPVAATSWSYDNDAGQWQFARTGATTAPSDEGWTFDNGTMQWRQAAPDNSHIWHFRSNKRNGQWRFDDDAADAWWQFHLAGNTTWRYTVATDTPEPFYDATWWQYSLASGEWQQQQVQTPGFVGATSSWVYDDATSLWNTAAAPLTTRALLMPFPPTPFAAVKHEIETTVADVLAQGVLIGSEDGSGAGLMDAATSSFLPDGTFTFSDVTTMTWANSITVSGDVELHVKNDAVLTVGESAGDTVVVTPTDAATTAHLVFNVDEGATLEVRVLGSLLFRARQDLRLYLSFRGRGTTKFRMPSGALIAFSPSDEDAGLAGVCVQVLMEQYATDYENEKHQVVFEPWEYGVFDTTTRIVWGRYSCLRFLSANAQGVSEDTGPGYGSIAFDVAHQGVGRTVLTLARGKTAYDGSDAGLNIYGQLVEGSGDGGAVLSSDLSSNSVKPNKLAGIQATLAITDRVALASVVPDTIAPTDEQAASWVARDAAARRGLAILNHNQSYPRLAANLEQAATLEESSWSDSQLAHGFAPGCILGKNGRIDIQHNLFLDYIGASSNQAVDPEYLAGAGTTSAEVKYRNPSSLIIDGLGEWDMDFAGTMNASLYLRGTAGLLVRCGASSETGTLLNEITTVDGKEHLDATIGAGFYNGIFCPVVDAKGLQSIHESILLDLNGNPLLEHGGGPACLDGEHALTLEAPLAVTSVLGRFGFARNGYITIPSVQTDHTGREKGKVA